MILYIVFRGTTYILVENGGKNGAMHEKKHD
jgi:hypothetical protein